MLLSLRNSKEFYNVRNSMVNFFTLLKNITLSFPMVISNLNCNFVKNVFNLVDREIYITAGKQPIYDFEAYCQGNFIVLMRIFLLKL